MDKRLVKQSLSLVMSLLLCITSFNFSLIANAAESDGPRIVSFNELEEDIANQTLPIGASIEDVKLPNTLKATVETVEEVEVLKAVEKSEEPKEEEKSDSKDEISEETLDDAEEIQAEETFDEADSDKDEAVEEPTAEPDEAAPEENPEEAETPAEETAAEEPAAESAPTESDEATPEDPADSESVDVSLVDILFPAMIAHAEEVEPEETAESEEPSPVAGVFGDTTPEVEVQYETVKEKQLVQSEVTLENVKWNIQDDKVFDSNQESIYVFVPEIKTEYVIATALPTIKVSIENTNKKAAFEASQVVDGVRVTVKADAGVFPEGATLSVSKVTAAEEQAVEEAVDEERSSNKNVVESYTFDVKVLDKDGNEIQPDISKGTVKVSFTLEEVANDNLETDVYHIKGEVGNLTPEELEVNEVSETTVEATTDGFSYYTVEFTYNSLQYSMNGDTSVALSQILEAVGLTGNIETAESSNTELFAVEQQNGIWMVTALQAFSTNETLKVTLDGVEYEIEVTDDDYVAQVISTGGTQNFSTISAALEEWTPYNKGNTTLKLLQDVAIEDYISIYSSKTLDLNGHGIRYVGTGYRRILYLDLNTEDTFIITDTSEGVTHKYIIGDGDQGAGLANVDDDLSDNYETFTGGYITGATDTGIYANRGTLKIDGVTIIGNSSKPTSTERNAGGLYSYDCNVEIKNSRFIGNKFYYDGNTMNGAGAIYATGTGNLSIENTNIECNFAPSSYQYSYAAGGIYCSVDSDKSFTMKNVTVNGNVGKGTGGVYYGCWNVVLSDKNIISNNKKSDGTASNLCWCNYTNAASYMNISGVNVSDESSIGMSLADYTKLQNYFTKDATLISKKNIFTPDDSNYIIIADSTGLKFLKEPVTIDYANETASSVSDLFELATSNTATSGQAEINISSIIESENRVIYYRTAGETPGAWTAVSLSARPAAPTETFTTQKASSTDEEDGAIGGTTTAMEYKLSTAENYTACTGTSSPATVGTYLIRYKATSSAFASSTVSVNVEEKEPQEPPTANMFSVTPLSIDGTSGGSITITDITNLQFSSDDGDNWSDVTQTSITGLAKGSYSFRYKGTTEHSPSPALTVEVKQYVPYEGLTDSTPVELDIEQGEAPVVGDELTVTCTATGLTYQWYRGNTPINGATAQKYTVTAADVGKSIHVVVSQATDEFGDEYPDGPKTKASDPTAASEKKKSQPPSDVTQIVTIGYSSEKVSVDASLYELAYADKVPVSGGEIDITSVIDAESQSERVIYVRRKETSEAYASAWVALPISGRPAAPSGLTTVDAESAAVENGKIVGTTTDMEYRLVNSESSDIYIDATAESTTVAAGTYLVRFKAKASEKTYASKTFEVVVSSVAKPSFTIERVQVSDITENSVILNGALSPKEYAKDMTFIEQVGFMYKKSGDTEWTKVNGELQGDGTFIKSLSGLTSDCDYTYKVFLQAKVEESEEAKAYQESKECTFHTDKEIKTDTGKISGNIRAKDNDDKRSYIISVEKGNDIIASKSYQALSTTSVEYSFENLADGFYNVVCRTTDGKFTETQMLEVANGGNASAKEFVVLSNNVSTVVEVVGDAPKAAVEGLGNILIQSEKDSATGNKEIEVKFEVKNESEKIATQVEAIKQILTPGLKTGKVLEFTLTKSATVKDELGNVVEATNEDIGDSNDTVLQIIFDIAEWVSEGFGGVYRYHGETPEPLTGLDEKPTDSEKYVDGTYFFDKLTNYLFVYARKFSSYLIAVKDKDYVPPTSGGSSSEKTEASTVPVYRLYNTITGEHLYTMDALERANLLNNETAAGWTDEGIAWYASPNAGKAVYRLLDMTSGTGHIYTTDATIRSEYVAKGWSDEGIAWYAPAAAGREVFKLKGQNGQIFYTTSEAEKNACEAAGCVVEQNDFTAY